MRWRELWLVACALLCAGCAGHTGTMYDVRRALVENDLDAARARLAEAGRGTDDLLFALEDGLLLHVAGEPALSNARFEFAERRIDDLYTKSLTRAALSLVSSDLALKFEPHGIENFLINYYRALNYLELGEPQEAWVEWRKLALKLQFAAGHGDEAYLEPPFFHYMAGLGLEADDPNDAYISFRLAEQACRQRGASPPPELVDDLLQLARRLGFGDHLDAYQARYGNSASQGGSDGFETHPATAWGEVVVLVEDGFVAPLEELKAYIPITRQRAGVVHEGNRDAQIGLAEVLAREYDAGRYARVTPRWSRRREIVYVLPLALPAFGRGEPAVNRLEVMTEGDTFEAQPLLEVSALQRAAFEDRRLGIYAKTIARAIVKAAVAARLRKEAEEEGGESAGDVVGALANVVNVVTERADTRAWLGLPDRIWMVRLRLPAGTHELRLRLDGFEEIALDPLELQPGERRFVSYRVF